MGSTTYDNYSRSGDDLGFGDDDIPLGNPDRPSSAAGDSAAGDSAADNPSVVEFMAPLIAASLKMLPISSTARGAATTLLDEVTTAVRQQRDEKRARADVLAREKLAEEKRERAVAARMAQVRERQRRAELRAEQEAAERRQRREDEVMAALRRGAAAEATLAAQENAHWVETKLVEAAREQARRIAYATDQAEEVGATRESIAAALGLHILEQSIATSTFVCNVLEATIDRTQAQIDAAALRGTNSGPVA